MFTFQNNTVLKVIWGMSYVIIYLDVQQEILKTKTIWRARTHGLYEKRRPLDKVPIAY